MTGPIPNLWPENFGESDKLTPVSILKQQGVYLGQKTNNLVIGEVRSLAGADFVRHFFELSAPLMGYNHSLFYIEHDPVKLYPVEIKSRGGVLGPEGKADTPDQFLAELKEILNSENTKQIIQSLIAQSRS